MNEFDDLDKLAIHWWEHTALFGALAMLIIMDKVVVETTAMQKALGT